MQTREVEAVTDEFADNHEDEEEAEAEAGDSEERKEGWMRTVKCCCFLSSMSAGIIAHTGLLRWGLRLHRHVNKMGLVIATL